MEWIQKFKQEKGGGPDLAGMGAGVWGGGSVYSGLARPRGELLARDPSLRGGSGRRGHWSQWGPPCLVLYHILSVPSRRGAGHTGEQMQSEGGWLAEVDQRGQDEAEGKLLRQKQEAWWSREGESQHQLGLGEGGLTGTAFLMSTVPTGSTEMTTRTPVPAPLYLSPHFLSER